jgi:F-type H+-transporting ATPase subunit b
MDFLPLVGIAPDTIVFVLINTGIMYALYKFLLHNKVVAMLEKRQQIVSDDLSAAEQAKLSAQDKEKEYTALLADSKAEAERIISAATARAIEKEKEIISEANQSAAGILKKADESIELEKKRAVNEIKNQISELVILTAQAVAEKEISEKENSALIDSFLVKM